ncbi:MAG: prepilin-type N-terminal cleavage/methylation domain-containing protein [Candidatus Falkowbacteria bacterium]|nr:prepilin-type N-terminal cleavage/methylation domain-containing protein [Candidatus Falkowbacteria bacterium]
MFFYKNKKAFTLIELLVVIAIIGVLSTMAIIALGNARAKARDAKRVADIKQISTALELYYSDYNSYPTIITPGNSISSPDGTKVYMANIPNNPTPRNDGNCGNVDYSYQSSLTGTNYSLGSCLGSGSGNMSAGAFFTSNNSGPLACGQATVVDIDGNSYNTVQIGTQCWIKENLRTKTKPNGTAMTNLVDGSERDCISAANARGTEADCDAGYTLYTGVVVMNGSATPGARGICPAGWHVPTDEEQYTLESYLWDGTGSCSNSRSYSWECSSAGTKLKIGGTSGFQGVLTGARMSNGSTLAERTLSSYFWSSSGFKTRAIYTSLTTTDRRAYSSAFSFSLRCIKD